MYNIYFMPPAHFPHTQFNLVYNSVFKTYIFKPV